MNAVKKNAIARSLEKYFVWIDRMRVDRVVNILKPYVEGRTLDIGTGDGHVAAALHDDIVGIDIVVPHRTSIEVREFDGIRIPFEDKSFDTVLACTSLHHATNPDALIEEMKRVGKKIVLLEDNVDTLVDRWSVLSLHWKNDRMFELPYRSDGFRTLNNWKQFFEAHSLRLTHCSRHPGIQPDWFFLRHYLFVLETP